MNDKPVTLYRPCGQNELDLVAESGFKIQERGANFRNHSYQPFQIYPRSVILYVACATGNETHL